MLEMIPVRIAADQKMLADLAVNDAAAFAKLVEIAKKA